MNADILMIGKVLPMKDLGIYSIGRNIGMLIWMVCHQIFLQSYLPAVSSAQHDIPRVARMYGRSIALMLALTIPASMMLALFSRDVIALLYDPRYADAYISLFWFSLGGSCSWLRRSTATPSWRSASQSTRPFHGGRVPGRLSTGTRGREALRPHRGRCRRIRLGAGHCCSRDRLPLAPSGSPSRVLAPWSRIVLTCSAISCLYILLHPALNGLGPWNLPFIAVMLVLTFAVSGCTWLIREKAGYPAEVSEL